MPIADAAKALGITTDAIRKRLAVGSMRGRRQDGTRFWLIWLADAEAPAVDPDAAAPDVTPEELQETPTILQPGASGMVEALALLREQQETIRQLAGQVGFLQAVRQSLEERVRLLEAPQDAPEAPQDAPDEPPAPEPPAAPPEPPPAAPEPPRAWWRRALRRLAGD